MNKDQYLDQLYEELQKYDAENIIRHVSEYDYIISDQIDEGRTLDEAIKNLGTPEELAAEIAAEFNYSKIENPDRFEKPILKSDTKYSTRHQTTTLIVNIIFYFIAFFYFIYIIGGLVATTFGLIAINFIGSFIITTIFGIISVVFLLILGIAVFMIFLNLKNKLIANLGGTNEN